MMCVSNEDTNPHSLITVFVVRIEKSCTPGYPKCIQSDQNLRWVYMSEDVHVRRYLSHVVAEVVQLMQCNAIQYNTIQYNTIQYNTIQYNTIQYMYYNTIQYNVLYCNVLYCIVMYCIVLYLYCIVLYCIVLESH